MISQTFQKYGAKCIHERCYPTPGICSEGLADNRCEFNFIFQVINIFGPAIETAYEVPAKSTLSDFV